MAVGDDVIKGQTLFIIEAMKVFNKIAAPHAGKITRLTDVNGSEVEVGDMLAEIA
ncbi:Biotin carboxyl carrier protein of acetyl-CoA carboxylase [compost metagenome]